MDERVNQLLGTILVPFAIVIGALLAILALITAAWKSLFIVLMMGAFLVYRQVKWRRESRSSH
jgi:uncharacterized membrane protein